MTPDPSPTPLQSKIFNKHYDSFRRTGKLNPEILEYCDRYQQYAINELKKSLIRDKNDKLKRQVSED